MSLFSSGYSVVTTSCRLGAFLVHRDEIELDADYQRGYVWEEEHQQHLLHSIFNKQPFPAIAVIENPDPNTYMEIVDGKQRITTLYLFFDNKIPYKVDDKEVYWDDMSLTDQRLFKGVSTSMYSLKADNGMPQVTELQKLEFFYSVNFGGVAQSDEHRDKVARRILELKEVA